jgi:[acyl-carrier-protein] S-malonyltransferase
MSGCELQERLEKQITGSVRWSDISRQLPELGITQSIEVGSGKVGGLSKYTGEGITNS